MSDPKEIFQKTSEKFPSEEDEERIKTRNSTLNNILGGGFPIPRIATLWGPAGVGKSHIATEFGKAFCDAGYFAVFADFEGGMTADLMMDIAGDHYGESFFLHKKLADVDDFEELSEQYIEADMPGLIIVDSMEAVVPLDRDEDGNYRRVSDMSIGKKALKDAQALRKWSALWKKNDISTILIEQQRTNFAGGGYTTYKDDSGAEGVNFYSDIKFRLRPDDTYFDDNGNHVASDIEIEMEKNKTENLKSGVVQLKFGSGFDPVMTVRSHIEEHGEELEWIEMKGAGWVTIQLPNGEEKVQGSEQMEEFIEDNLEYVVDRLKSDGIIKDG